MEGYEYEQKCAEYLLIKGYINVEVTQKSGDFGIDITAYKNGIKYGIQCKYYDKPVGNKAVQEAYAGAAYYNCDKPMVITNTTFTNQAQKLAAHLGVELWPNVNAIVLMESLTMTSADIIFKKIIDTRAFCEKSYKDLQNSIKNFSSYTDFFASACIGNNCSSLMYNVDSRLKKLADEPPCPKTAVLELINLLKKIHQLLISLSHNGGIYSNYINDVNALVEKWTYFSYSINFLDEEIGL